jgi:hypothetical protein
MLYVAYWSATGPGYAVLDVREPRTNEDITALRARLAQPDVAGKPVCITWWKKLDDVAKL